MKKIIIDCNIFDKMIFDKDLLLQSLGEYEYFIISIQYDELKKIPNSKKEWRESLLSLIDILKITTVYTTPAIYGKAKYGLAKYGGDTDAFNKILKTTRSNINDALIASSAISHGYILVTDDNELRRKMKNNNYEVMTYSELLNDIKNIVHKV